MSSVDPTAEVGAFVRWGDRRARTARKLAASAGFIAFGLPFLAVAGLEGVVPGFGTFVLVFGVSWFAAKLIRKPLLKRCYKRIADAFLEIHPVDSPGYEQALYAFIVAKTDRHLKLGVAKRLPDGEAMFKKTGNGTVAFEDSATAAAKTGKKVPASLHSGDFAALADQMFGKSHPFGKKLAKGGPAGLSGIPSQEELLAYAKKNPNAKIVVTEHKSDGGGFMKTVKIVNSSTFGANPESPAPGSGDELLGDLDATKAAKPEPSMEPPPDAGEAPTESQAPGFIPLDPYAASNGKGRATGDDG